MSARPVRAGGTPAKGVPSVAGVNGLELDLGAPPADDDQLFERS